MMPLRLTDEQHQSDVTFTDEMSTLFQDAPVPALKRLVIRNAGDDEARRQVAAAEATRRAALRSPAGFD